MNQQNDNEGLKKYCSKISCLFICLNYIVPNFKLVFLTQKNIASRTDYSRTEISNFTAIVAVCLCGDFSSRQFFSSS